MRSYRNLMWCYFAKEFPYLKEKGWLKSQKTHSSIDANNNPIPWYTYPFLDFLEPMLKRKISIFEYGSGSSTFWWSKFADNIITCEHDKNWVKKLGVLPSNVKLIVKDLNDGYADVVTLYKNHFEVIIIDGRKRNECMKNCVSSLKEDGIIIVDNSDRTRYNDGFNYLREKGFKRLDFWGIGSINSEKWCTSLLYREKNFFGI